MKILLCFIFSVVLFCFGGSVRSANTLQVALGEFSVKQEASMTTQDSADLSGDYVGRITIGISKTSSKARLKIEKNEFKLTTEDGRLTLTGQIRTLTTGTYTTAAFRITDVAGYTKNGGMLEGKTISITVKRGRTFKLTDAPGENLTFIFQCDCNSCKNPKKCDCCGG